MTTEAFPPEHPLRQLDTLSGYRLLFTDAHLWRSYVQEVCRRRGLAPCDKIRSALPGTCPTFIVEERWVVKFFGRLFEGALAFETELQIGRLLDSYPSFPTPAIIASGDLLPGSDDWHWPYLVIECLPGLSFGEVRGQVAFEAKNELARSLGQLVRRLHQLPLTDIPCFPSSWDVYTAFLHRQRLRNLTEHRHWGALPERLLDQMEAFLLPVEMLIDRSRTPHLIHADITADHVMGRYDGTHWLTSGMIDFGDAMVGNLFYELVALHLDLFDCDKRLLRSFLETYGGEERFDPLFPAKAMSVTLLHEFDVLGPVFESHPHLRDVATLEQLAALLWDLEAPGPDQEASPAFALRAITSQDEPFLWEALYHALYLPPGAQPYRREILERDEISRYVQNWGYADDIGYLAISGDEGKPIGAAWVRLLKGENKGYGYVADTIPELTIAILPEYRGKGIGSALLTQMLAVAQERYPAVSLSVSGENPALYLYRRLGFVVVGGSGDSLTMVKCFHVTG